MSRLTHKDFDNNYYCYKTRDDFIDGYFTRENKEWFYGNVVEKLGKLEDIEEELGCPLEVLIKPLLEGGIIDNDGYGVQLNGLAINGDGSFSLTAVNGDHYDLKKYKKTWWLEGEQNETL